MLASPSPAQNGHPMQAPMQSGPVSSHSSRLHANIYSYIYEYEKQKLNDFKSKIQRFIADYEQKSSVDLLEIKRELADKNKEILTLKIENIKLRKQLSDSLQLKYSASMNASSPSSGIHNFAHSMHKSPSPPQEAVVSQAVVSQHVTSLLKSSENAKIQADKAGACSSQTVQELLEHMKSTLVKTSQETEETAVEKEVDDISEERALVINSDSRSEQTVEKSEEQKLEVQKAENNQSTSSVKHEKPEAPPENPFLKMFAQSLEDQDQQPQTDMQSQSNLCIDEDDDDEFEEDDTTNSQPMDPANLMQILAQKANFDNLQQFFRQSHTSSPVTSRPSGPLAQLPRPPHMPGIPGFPGPPSMGMGPLGGCFDPSMLNGLDFGQSFLGPNMLKRKRGRPRKMPTIPTQFPPAKRRTKMHANMVAAGYANGICPVCDSMLKSSSHLDIHMRKHVNAKPFKCPSCDYRSVQKGNLKQHIERHHVETLVAQNGVIDWSRILMNPESGIWGDGRPTRWNEELAKAIKDTMLDVQQARNTDSLADYLLLAKQIRIARNEPTEILDRVLENHSKYSGPNELPSAPGQSMSEIESLSKTESFCKRETESFCKRETETKPPLSIPGVPMPSGLMISPGMGQSGFDGVMKRPNVMDMPMFPGSGGGMLDKFMWQQRNGDSAKMPGMGPKVPPLTLSYNPSQLPINPTLPTTTPPQINSPNTNPSPVPTTQAPFQPPLQRITLPVPMLNRQPPTSCPPPMLKMPDISQRHSPVPQPRVKSPQITAQLPVELQRPPVQTPQITTPAQNSILAPQQPRAHSPQVPPPVALPHSPLVQTPDRKPSNEIPSILENSALASFLQHINAAGMNSGVQNSSTE